jgi:hypothetical protein
MVASYLEVGPERPRHRSERLDAEFRMKETKIRALLDNRQSDSWYGAGNAGYRYKTIAGIQQ